MTNRHPAAKELSWVSEQALMVCRDCGIRVVLVNFHDVRVLEKRLYRPFGAGSR